MAKQLAEGMQFEFRYFRSSPLPPPQEAEHWERLHPGAAGEILNSFQDKMRHDMAMERRDSNTRRWVLVTLVVIMLIPCTLAAYLGYLGLDVIAGIAAIGSFLSPVTWFWVRRRLARKDSGTGPEPTPISP
ncbi:MAG: hypothetical protein OXB92_06030 [Acidimicrobiaceae bacterium]|nr:hypothetical protein [Acidimicrobiaceae bacterium]